MNARRPIFVFFLFAFSVYFALSAGYTDSADAEPSIETARAIGERGTLAVATTRYGVSDFLYSRGKNGEFFSKMGLLYPVLYLPAVGIAKLIARGNNETRWINFIISFVNPLLAATTVTLIFAFFLQSGSSARQAAWIAGSLAFATLWFPYSKSAAREVLQGLLLVTAFYGARFSLTTLGVSLILAPFAKETLVVAMLPALIIGFRRNPRTRHQLATWSIAAILAAVLAIVGYWSFQSGELRATGYGTKVWGWCRNDPPWSTSFWAGAFQQWLSPERGMIFLSPLILVPLAWCARKITTRRFTGLDAGVTFAILFTSVLHARWFAPCGEQDLGCRYLIPVLPLFAFFMMDLPESGRLKTLATILVGLALLQQIPHVLVKPQQFWTAQALAGEPLGMSFTRANLVFLKHKIQGKPEIYPLTELGLSSPREISLEPFRSFQGFNFWWLHAIRYQRNPTEKPNLR